MRPDVTASAVCRHVRLGRLRAGFRRRGAPCLGARRPAGAGLPVLSDTGPIDHAAFYREYRGYAETVAGAEDYPYARNRWRLADVTDIGAAPENGRDHAVA